MNALPLTRRFVAVCVAALSVTTLPMAADARSMNGHAGLAMPKSDQYCLSSYYGMFNNQCEHPVDVMYAPIMDNGTYETVNFTGRAFSATSSVACILVSTDLGITTYTTTGWASLPNDGVVHDNGFNLVTLTGPKYFQCRLGQGAALYSLSYSQWDNYL